MVAHGIISFFGWHKDYHNISIVEHFLGGMAITIAIIELIQPRNYKREIEYLLPFLVTALATIVWEFYEFLSDRYIGTTLQQSIANTMEDMALGLVGSLIVIVLYCIFSKRSSRN